ncbi:MAG: phosphatidate cytidylyltransferase [Gammaproteobacteria bacterium]
MSNLATRIITAIVLVLVVLAVLFVLPSPSALYFFALVFLVAGWEWAGLIKPSASAVKIMFLILLAVVAFLPGVIPDLGVAWLFIYGGALCWLLFTLILLMNIPVNGLAKKTLAGLMTLLPAWYALNEIMSQPDGAYYFLGCVAIVAAADIGAYFSGRSFGKHKLAPAISPGKTIEGFVGGLIMAGIVTALLADLTDRNALIYLLPGCLIAAVSVSGDLWISRFKRLADVKDSGKILPGHGGVLDRVDSLLAALPFFALLAVEGQTFGL